MELGHARVSTTKQDLDRQIDALTAAGVDPQRIYVDRKSGAPPIGPG
ncbi:recombinase family protein [Rhodococcus sp. Q1]|nr:recombinase family protein [Rhodococcus sp. Q1]